MRELNALALEGPGDSTKKDDIFSKVMGQEKPGHVRMYGLGVCPSDLWGSTPSHATSHRMTIELKTTLDKLIGQYDELSNKFEEINSRFIEGEGMQDGDYVFLKSIMDPTLVIAKGVISNINQVGQNWCELHVKDVVNLDEQLVRPYGLFQTVGDAIGAHIAWPTSLIELEEDDG